MGSGNLTRPVCSGPMTTLAAVAWLLLGQVPVEHPPEPATLRAALLEARAKRPRDTAAFLAVKQGPIEPTLAADLLAFDWLLPGAWSYPEKKFGVEWEQEDPDRHQWNRHLPDGGVLSFAWTRNLKDEAKSQVTHTNFTLPPPTRVQVVKAGRATYLELTAYGEKELHRVVSYEKGVLVLDVSYDGKPNSKRVKFREVRVAMPKCFESSGT